MADTSVGLTAVEAKSGATVAGDFLRPLHRFLPETEELRRLLVFGGDDASRRSGIRIVPWREIQGVRWA
ncbi:MAG: hypothetical protein ACRD2Z_15170 [Thermoanaerobaculia bacterium]